MCTHQLVRSQIDSCYLEGCFLLIFFADRKTGVEPINSKSMPATSTLSNTGKNAQIFLATYFLSIFDYLEFEK